jgi:type IV pilus assembly protein PilB
VRLVNALLEQAANDQASDLHIEPTADNVMIRQRIDGVLHDTSEAPLGVLRPLISRIKVLAGLDIAQARLPQDGRFSATIQGRTVDIRVATVPTATGEAMVLRLLDPSRGAIELSALGLSSDELARLEPAFRAPQGAVFVTGPTGSGKTSTLYAAISAIATRDKSIVSVEDPVEYRLRGVKQIQVHPKAGLTFPVALRSILRMDPDVIFVGEVRDGETARIAADASITGHLVLSTLHTTSAAATPMRLIDMGLEPYLVASAITSVAAQRLVRRLCEQCAQPIGRSEAVTILRDLNAVDTLVEDATIRAAVGCPSCRNTGYHGRDAIYEIMPVTEQIARLIVERAAIADIERCAIGEGMDTLRAAALKRVVRGELSVDEMLRVIS